MLKIIQEDPELSAEELRESLIKIAQARLTKKQKSLLLFLTDQNSNCNVTRLVPILAGHLQCAPSTVWSNLNVLRVIGLVDFGNADSKGKPLRLTRLGTFVTKELGE